MAPPDKPPQLFEYARAIPWNLILGVLAALVTLGMLVLGLVEPR